ncbi:MAG: ATP-binding protein [Sporomusaceae bacterium]|nr:ATP-binding protein [Sporomusaceae bacterium]
MGFYSTPQTTSLPAFLHGSLSQKRELADYAAPEYLLSANNRQLKQILQFLPIAAVLIEAGSKRFIYLNQQAERLYGVNYTGCNLDEHLSAVHALTPDGAPFPAEQMPVSLALDFGQATNETAMLIAHAEGRQFLVSVSAIPLYDDGGEIAAALVLFNPLDTVASRPEGTAATAQQALLDSLIDLLPLDCWIADTTGKVTLSNDQAHRDGIKLWQSGTGEAVAAADLPLARALRGEHGKELVMDIETADGRRSPCSIAYGPVQTAAGSIIGGIAIAQDITERRQLERELLRLDRLNTVGEIAASIGHEIRNPLTTVRGYLQMLQQKGENAAYQEQFALMIDELDRANCIISDFLSLAKSSVVETKPDNLNRIIRSLEPLLQAEALRVGHELCIEGGDLPAIWLNEKEIRQLLLNLVRNAFEAMDAGGRLTISTRLENGEILLAVRDTGKGIPPEILAKLGTPFLTSKEKGTGLGLTVCYRIAKHHQARIVCSSSPQGTTVTVKFPT